MTQYPYVGDFKLSMTAALRDQLVSLLDTLEPAPLTTEALDTLDQRGGIYQLFAEGVLVYVGKSTSRLPARLTQHRVKIAGRIDNLIDRMTFKCAYVDEDLDAVAPEKLLIKQFRDRGEAEWNTNGFGNKDPGRQRDTSTVKRAHFDRLHPIDLEKRFALHIGRSQPTLLSVMSALKFALPYTYRFGTDRAAKHHLDTIDVSADFMPGTELTAREWFGWISERLPEGWATVALPGYVISYRDLDPETVPSRTADWSYSNGRVVFEYHEAQFEEGEVELDEAGVDP